MTTYIEQINKKIDASTRKLASLEEYKQSVLSKQGQTDEASLKERLEEIDEEYQSLQKSIRVNSKAKEHYEAAYRHLLELRTLDSRLQSVVDPKLKEETEQAIIEHTEKLQRHLTKLPEKLITELQQKYLQETEEENATENQAESSSPSTIEDNSTDRNENVMAEENAVPVVIDNTMNTEVSPVTSATEIDSTPIPTPEAEAIYMELLQIFDDEAREMNEIVFFDDQAELEDFLDKYKQLKMECHARLLKAINESLMHENMEAVQNSSNDSIEDEEQQEIPITGEAPIIIMLDLVDKLEITNDPNQKLHPTNIEISDNFKEELTHGNWLYNVIHYTTELTATTDEDGKELLEELSKLDVNKKRIDILKERVAKLPKINVAKVYNEYYSNSSKTRLTTALKVLLDEAVNKLI